MPGFLKLRNTSGPVPSVVEKIKRWQEKKKKLYINTVLLSERSILLLPNLSNFFPFLSRKRTFDRRRLFSLLATCPQRKKERKKSPLTQDFLSLQWFPLQNN